mgnify:CR=1 FL=1
MRSETAVCLCVYVMKLTATARAAQIQDFFLRSKYWMYAYTCTVTPMLMVSPVALCRFQQLAILMFTPPAELGFVAPLRLQPQIDRIGATVTFTATVRRTNSRGTMVLTGQREGTSVAIKRSPHAVTASREADTLQSLAGHRSVPCFISLIDFEDGSVYVSVLLCRSMTSLSCMHSFHAP